MKYILVTGGIQSGIGKGVIASSIGALLKACEKRVTAIKIDPYINIDAGTFSPYEHGEVFVLDDGCEVDLDLGNYERFLETRLHGKNNITTGKIYQDVFDRSEKGEYSEEFIEIDPHVIDCIQEWIKNVARVPSVNDLAHLSTNTINDAVTVNGDYVSPEVCIIELGGTAGDIEGVIFIEALNRLRHTVKSENFCCIHVTLVANINGTGPLETYPSKGGVQKLQNGLRPDLIVCRSEAALPEDTIDIISRDCNINPDKVFNLPDFRTIYMVPIELARQGVVEALNDCLKLELQLDPTDKIKRWNDLSTIATTATEEVIIGLVGKYTAFRDSYTSVIKAVEHACYSLGMQNKKGLKPSIRYIDSSSLIQPDDTDPEKIEKMLEYNRAWNDLKSSHGLLVPGAFGYRGVEGIIVAIEWARTNKVPFLGICLGFQAATIEYARNVLGIKEANSAEFATEANLPSSYIPIVIEMLEYQDPMKKLGGTMRLGSRATKFVTSDSILRKLYGDVDAVYERHRHRYEINPEYVDRLETSGLRFVGKNDDEIRMEILELDESTHPFYVAVQYHPEYLTRPFKPSPPYLGLIKASRTRSQDFVVCSEKDA